MGTKKQQRSYTEALKELEKIVVRLQQDDCEIDELKVLTTRSLELVKLCKTRLFETDKELEKILEELQ